MTKQELIDKYRYKNVEHDDWYEGTFEDFKEDMIAKFIFVRNIRFSGFCSQGDGASFTGHITCVPSFLARHKLTGKYPVLHRLLAKGGELSLLITRSSGHYCHENMVKAEIAMCSGFRSILPHGDPLRDTVVEMWDSKLEIEYSWLESDATEIIRRYCRDLYKKLEKEHDYLTSDEAVLETIEINDYIEEAFDETSVCSAEKP